MDQMLRTHRWTGFTAAWLMVDIEMIKTPALSDRARQINVDTHPILREEALANQTYRVHLVSGATETTIGWARALRDALDKAEFCTLPGTKCDLPLR
jgi:hypothetical protein